MIDILFKEIKLFNKTKLLIFVLILFTVVVSVSYAIFTYETTSSNSIKLTAKTEVYNQSFGYTGSVQTLTIPKDGYYKIELWGAQGEAAGTTVYIGGLGGYTSGVGYFNEGEIVYIYVGGIAPGKGPGGYNGGGSVNVNQTFGGAGGGATDIRFGGTALVNRIMVAGGGGGAGSRGGGYGDGNGGSGGNLIGENGKVVNNTNNHGAWPGYGGKQNVGGSMYKASGNSSETCPDSICKGIFGAGKGSSVAGGGGYYGGGGYGHAGGGGGSSYISGYAGVNSVASNSSHLNETRHYSTKYFTDGKMESGVNTGAGKALITFVGTSQISKTNTKLNNVRYIKSCMTGNTVNNPQKHWVELQAINNGINIAKGKSITGTGAAGTPYARVVDGDITASGYGSTSAAGVQCVTVDLGAIYDLDEIGLWLYYEDSRKYYDNILSVGTVNASGTTNLSTVLHTYAAETETSDGYRYTAWD